MECLASGAFGDTYHAVDTVLDEEVALKVFSVLFTQELGSDGSCACE